MGLLETGEIDDQVLGAAEGVHAASKSGLPLDLGRRPAEAARVARLPSSHT